MERGHQGWDQHRAQGQCQYHDWKEHRFTYISSARRIAEFCLSEDRATLRDTSPPLLDLSIHLVIGADKPLLDN
jgi:hypothetical protein